MHILILLVVIVLAGGCTRESHERHYQEIVIEAPVSDLPSMAKADDPHAGLDLSLPPISSSPSSSDFLWEVPENWSQQPGSALRLATFKEKEYPEAIDVSIVSLSGAAGGIEANLRRWAGQIHVSLDEEVLARLMKSASILKTKAGQEASIYDFTTLQPAEDQSSKSTMVGVIQSDDATVFVKMTGAVAALRRNQAAFQQLTESIRKK